MEESTRTCYEVQENIYYYKVRIQKAAFQIYLEIKCILRKFFRLS